ncbi:hypothetical protein D3C84_622620 [compost metagenome]
MAWPAASAAWLLARFAIQNGFIMPVTIMVPWMPANQRIWHSNTASRTAGRLSEAATRGLSMAMIASGRIIPVVSCNSMLRGCRVRMIASTGISTSKERATPIGTCSGRRMVMLLRLSQAYTSVE